MDINSLTQDQVKAVFRCGNSGCACHRDTGNVHCPCHDDKNPDMSLKKENGALLAHCFAGCDQDSVFRAVSERVRAHYDDNGASQKREGGLTLQELAAAKKIPIENLKQWHVLEYTKGKKPYVIIPFHDESNKPLSTQFRFNMSEKPKWKKGNKPQLYGRWLLPEFDNDSVILVEGASDCWTMWFYNIQAIGIPSKTGWRSGYAEYFKQFQNVYLWQEPDATKLPGIIGKDIPGLKVLKPNGFKDISETHIQGLDVKKTVQEMVAQAIPYEPEKEISVRNQYEFWKFEEDEKTGNVKVSIYEYGLIIFLENNGFYRLPYDKRYLYVRVDDNTNIVEIAESVNVKDFVISYLKDTDLHDSYKELVISEIHRNKNRFFQEWSLNTLSYSKIGFLKDAKDAAYFLFKNGFVSVTKNDIKLHAYSELKTLNKYIWSSQIKSHGYQVDNNPPVFEDFLKNVSSHHLTDNELEIEIVKGEMFTEGAKGRWLKHSDYLSKVTSFGYLLHSYKNPSNAKAVVCVDAEIADSQEGGTGKSLFACKAIGSIKNVKECDGKKFIPGERFSFQGVNPSTQIIAIDDCHKRFDFEGLFHAVTGDLVVEEKHKPEYTIPFEDSPKFTLTTNHTLKGDGHSYERRQHIIEFSDFYVKEGKPQNVHGGTFFHGWQESEWNRFYTFAFKCVQEYLKQGLVVQKTRNYELKKLLSTVPEELITWFDKNIEIDTEYVKSERYEQMKTDIATLKELRSNTFTASLKRWCKARGYRFNPHKNGSRDLRHGIDYIAVKK